MASEAKLRPWQNVGTDMFFFKRATHLLVVDYCSSYVEIAKLDETTSSDVIIHQRSIFARHGIPKAVVSDNGHQYVGHEFARFAERTGFTRHQQSSVSPKQREVGTSCTDREKPAQESVQSVCCLVGVPCRSS